MTSNITHVKLVYFKEDSGNYYSEGEVNLPWKERDKIYEPVAFHEALSIVRGMLDSGIRPGLVEGHHFDVLVTVYTEYGPINWLYVRKERP